MILINGDFLCRRITGIERYAREISIRIDKICKPHEIAILVPKNTANVPEYVNFKIIRHKKNIKSHFFWQMFTLQYFLMKNPEFTILEFGNTCLPFTPGIVFLHDIYCKLYPNDFLSLRDRIIRLYNCWQYYLIAKKSLHIITVSQFTKDEIMKIYKVPSEKISIVYSSWNHFKDITADYSVFNSIPLIKQSYYFSLGSLSKRKNLKWIIEYAKMHKDSIFVLSGESLPTVKEKELDKLSNLHNLIFPGYLDDSKTKALMEKCKAFILPSYYEGFGLTPLEALSCGAQIIIANSASLPEIYGNTAHYIDAFNTNIDLDELLKETVSKPDEILAKYSYETSAENIYNKVKEFSC